MTDPYATTAGRPATRSNTAGGSSPAGQPDGSRRLKSPHSPGHDRLLLAMLADASVNASLVVLNEAFPIAVTTQANALLAFAVAALALILVTRAGLGCHPAERKVGHAHFLGNS